jgi:hypothetical protein
LISIMFASMVGIMSSTLISGMVRLVVSIVALIKIGASLLLATVLPGASLVMTLGDRRRWGECTPLVDLNCGNL